MRALWPAGPRGSQQMGTFRASPVADADKVDILRDYLHHWKWEVGVFFDGVGPDSSDTIRSR